MKKKSFGGVLKLWAFHPPPPHVFFNGIALSSLMHCKIVTNCLCASFTTSPTSIQVGAREENAYW